MNETVKKYRNTMGRLGAVLLLFLIMLYGSARVVQLLSEILSFFLSRETVEILSSLLSSAVYFASFTLAARFYHLGRREDAVEPVRFAPRLPSNSFLIVFAGVACTLSLALVNSMAAELLGFGEPPEIFNLPDEFSGDYAIVLQFIAIAIVPAFCEEILFRGVVLSNLMPYGKASAIAISAVLFGLMHGNAAQFLYATAAGIIMGCVYVLTDSIWCSILLHFINNTVSVLQFAVVDRFSEEYAWIIVLAYECILIFVGIICAFVLVSKKRKNGKSLDLGSITFSKEISPSDSAKGFLVPSMLAFSIISVVLALLRV